jgi:hypothetical protein
VFDTPHALPVTQAGTPQPDLLFAASTQLTTDTTLAFSSYPSRNFRGTFPVWRLEGDEFAYLTNPANPQICRHSGRSVTAPQIGCQAALFIIPNIPNSRWDPVWSPDGNRQAFLEVNASGTRVDLILRDAGLNRVSLTHALPGVSAAVMPAWSPSGTHLAFAAGNPAMPGTFAIYTVDVTAAVPTARRLTTPSGYLLPMWSADGTQIAFMQQTSSGTPFFVLPFSAAPPPTPTGTPPPTPTPAPYPTFAPSSDSQWGAVYAPGMANAYAHLTGYDAGSRTFAVMRGGVNLGRGIGVKVRPAQPQHCEVMNAVSAVRFQPTLYDGDRLFSMTGAWPARVVTDIPNRPWLWSDGAFTVPTALRVRAMVAKASVGIIDWISAADRWLQVEVTHDGAGSALWAYVGIAGTVDLYGQGYAGCDAAALPLPTPDPNLPIVAFSTAQPSFDVPRGPIFSGNQPPATMGNLGLHDGVQTRRPGATLDIVPANVELCIDSEINFVPCDSVQLIPVFSPVSGCGLLGLGQRGQLDTIQINIDLLNGGTCGQRQSNNDRVIYLTHVRYQGFSLASGNSLDTNLWRPVQLGEQLGVLCNSTTATKLVIENGCNVDNANHTHLAFQLGQVSYSASGNRIQRSGDVLAFLAYPTCLYDRWVARPSHPLSPLHQNAPFHGCLN